MIINDATKLGSGGSNLVLETAGKVYIKVADRFYELDFKNPGGRTIRVNSSGEEQEAPEIDMSQYVTKKYLRSALSNYITQRGWEDIQETKHMLENALLDGFTESINPVTVETMQLIVGTESLQFDFIDGLLTGNPRGAGFELMEGNSLRCPDNFIKHYTLDGPSSVRPHTPIQLYSRWTVKNTSDDSNGNTYLEMPEDDLPYYVYIRAPKYINSSASPPRPYTDEEVENNIDNDPKGSGIATYLISQSAIELETDDDSGYYYFLTAIITSKSNGFRSIGYMNGFTEILPGQITAYVFKTPDGTQYLDFLSEEFKIGNSVNYLDWNVTEPNTLTIRGSLTATGGEVKESIDKLNGLIGTVWFSSDAPSAQELPYPTASDSTVNWPASLWTTTELKRAHVGNHYYVETGTDAGKIFVYVHNSGNYYWEEENNSDYEYLIKAIKGRTDLNGGLILANMMQLGHSWGSPDDIDDYYSKFIVMSGINGTLKTVGNVLSYETIAAWYGGPMRDFEKEYVSGNHYDYFVNTIFHDKYTFVEHDQTTGYYKWSVTGTELDVYVQNNPPQVGDTVYYYAGGLIDSATTVEYYSNGFATSLFRMDGTGYLAKGNISWDTDGRLTLKHITVTEDAKIGPMEISTAGVVSVTNSLGEQIFNLTKNSCDIVGSLKAVSKSYYDPATISVIDSSGTKIADIGSQPISTTNIPTYIRKADSQQAFYGKGSVFWGTVTIPENWYFSILDRYDCWVSGETYKVSRLRLNYDFTRISRNITLKIYIRKVPFGTDFDLGTDYQRYSHTFTTSDWIATGTIYEDDLTSNGEITTELGCSYFLLVHLVEGGQVQSSIASDSWMSVSTGANCEATVTRSSAPIELGTYIRPNGISSVFGTNSKFQWLGAMLFNSYSGGYSDFRDKGGNFIVELPYDENNSNQIGLRLTGFYDANANTTEGAGFRINLGSGWYKLKIDGDTLKVDASQ